MPIVKYVFAYQGEEMKIIHFSDWKSRPHYRHVYGQTVYLHDGLIIPYIMDTYVGKESS